VVLGHGPHRGKLQVVSSKVNISFLNMPLYE